MYVCAYESVCVCVCVHMREREREREREWVCVFVCVYTYPTARAGCDTRSIFIRSLTGLNSEFSFPLTGCHTKVKEPSLPNYLPLTGGSVNATWNASSIVRDLKAQDASFIKHHRLTHMTNAQWSQARYIYFTVLADHITFWWNPSFSIVSKQIPRPTKVEYKKKIYKSILWGLIFPPYNIHFMYPQEPYYYTLPMRKQRPHIWNVKDLLLELWTRKLFTEWILRQQNCFVCRSFNKLNEFFQRSL